MLSMYVVYNELGKMVYYEKTLIKAQEKAKVYSRQNNIICYIYKQDLIDIIGG